MATTSPEPVFIKYNSRSQRTKGSLSSSVHVSGLQEEIQSCPACVPTSELITVDGKGEPLLGQAWATCPAVFGEEGKENRTAIFKYLEMCSPRGSGDSLTKAEGQNSQCPPGEFYFRHIHHAQLLTVANFQKRRPRQAPCDCAASLRSVDRIIALYQRFSNFLSSSKQKLPVSLEQQK